MKKSDLVLKKEMNLQLGYLSICQTNPCLSCFSVLFWDLNNNRTLYLHKHI